VARGGRRCGPPSTENGARGIFEDEICGGELGADRFFARHKSSLG
jgi:hypothetical protein